MARDVCSSQVKSPILSQVGRKDRKLFSPEGCRPGGLGPCQRRAGEQGPLCGEQDGEGNIFYPSLSSSSYSVGVSTKHALLSSPSSSLSSLKGSWKHHCCCCCNGRRPGTLRAPSSSLCKGFTVLSLQSLPLLSAKVRSLTHSNQP